MRRSERVLRAAALACVSTSLALALHLAGGGAMPAAPGLAAPLVVAFVVGVQLAGVAMSRWRLATSVLVAQAAFHTMFAFGSGAAVAAIGPGHHPGRIAVDPSAATVAHDHGGQSTMMVAHLLAALATYVVLRRADVLLAWGARLVGAVLARLTIPCRAAAFVRPPRRAPILACAARTRIASTPRPLRGPPFVLT